MVQSQLRFRFLLQEFYGELCFADHQHAARAQSQNRGRARGNCQSGSSAEENGVAIVSLNRTAYGDERGCREQAEPDIEEAESFYK